MKKVLLTSAILALASMNLPAYAVDKVVITGSPIVLTAPTTGEAYTLPADFTAKEFTYVTLDGTDRVCYADAQPSLASLDVKVISVTTGGSTMTWNCYQMDNTYFEMKQ